MTRLPILLFLLSPLAYAGENTDVANAVIDNISSEYASCAAYFALVSQAIASAKEHEVADQYKNMYTIAMQTALTAAEKTRSEEMALKVTLARYDNYLEAMKSKIDNSYSNISLLFSEYAQECKGAIEKPETFMNVIGERTAKKYEKKR